MLAHALRQFNEQIRKMLERLMEGEQLSQEELERLAKFVGLGQADDLRYREWMLQRMQNMYQNGYGYGPGTCPMHNGQGVQFGQGRGFGPGMMGGGYGRGMGWWGQGAQNP